MPIEPEYDVQEVEYDATPDLFYPFQPNLFEDNNNE